jgi:hypothetical protein
MTQQTGKSLSAASISKEGFCFTAILVAILWCILGMDRITLHRAQADSASARYTIERLRMRNRVRAVDTQSHPAAPELAPKPFRLVREI